MAKKIKLGMIGGGPDAFIGGVHRKAAALDGNYELIGGAFSSDPQKSKSMAGSLGLDPERVYGSYDEMFTREKALPEDQRIEAVSIVTPNHVHFDPALKALQNGFHVIVDKPLAYSLEQAKSLKEAVDESGLIFALTHTYCGYPMVKEARQCVSSGKIGNVRKVYVEYPQGWLATSLESDGNKQASWRTDPAKSGAGGAVGDIGTHAANLAEYVTSLDIDQLCGELNITVEGRRLDDDATALLKFSNGASGALVATQVATGEENDLKLRVYGEKGGLEWTHTDPNTLLVKMLDQPVQIYRTGAGYLSEAAVKNTRLPAGHPEGYLEAFANIYTAFNQAIQDYKAGNLKGIDTYDFPTVDEGVKGMAFIETMILSGKSTKKWTKILQ
ncbi:MAG: Gfo/Idh/MocA family oxidoreductase [Balneolales bacterium]